jgi:DNA-binding response OmpR family regulator
MRVLVVEDNDQVADALACVLTDAGMAVIGPTATPREAERLAIAQSPDLALVDFNLGGEQTAARLIERLRQRKLRVIVMSGLAMAPDSISKNAVFLQKPFSPDELFAAIHQGLHATV